LSSRSSQKEVFTDYADFFVGWAKATSAQHKICVICVANQQLLVFLARFSGPEGTEVNSRGRALCAKPTGVGERFARSPRELASALREAHGSWRALCAKPTRVKQQRLKTLKGSNNQPNSTLSGSADVTD